MVITTSKDLLVTSNNCREKPRKYLFPLVHKSEVSKPKFALFTFVTFSVKWRKYLAPKKEVWPT